MVERNPDEEAEGMYAKEVEAEFNKYKLDEALGIYASEVEAESGRYSRDASVIFR